MPSFAAAAAKEAPQKKKQATLSAFFTSTPSSTAQPVAATSKAPALGQTHSSPPTSPDASTTTGYRKRKSSPSIAIPHRSSQNEGQLKENGTKIARQIDPLVNQVEEESADADHAGPLKRRRLSHDPSSTSAAGKIDSLHIPNGEQATEQTADGELAGYVFSDRRLRRLSNGDGTQPNGEAATHSDDEEDRQRRRKKEKLHEKFVQKLGRPDAFANLRRRNRMLDESTPQDESDALGDDAGEDEAEDDDGQGQRPSAAKASYPAKRSTLGKGKQKLTPMERQVIDIKRKHMDTLLVVEVGYKYRFFGEDARVAAKELSIVYIPGKYRFDEHPSEAHLDRFASASIPVHRLHVHVRRLVAAGHKVGVVRQLETAALKAAGDNRNAPFVRKLTNLYTKGTYIDDVEGLDAPTAAPAGGAPATGHLLCLTETNAKGWGTDEKVHVGIIAVQPATGDIIYDDFEDGFMRSEIETRLLHIAPCEFLIVGDVSKATDKMIQHLSGSKTNVFGDKARVERTDKPKNMAAKSFEHIRKFYADKLNAPASANSEESTMSSLLDKVHQMSEHVTVCLSAMITHLSEYGLEHVFDLTKNFQAFSARSHMLLNGNTLASLEIYQNQTDFSERGSLFWVMDQTQTRFGQRMLRKWVGRPLLDRRRLEERIRAVEELKAGDRTTAVDKIKHLLSKVRGDLEKSLLRIYYKKCSRPELLNVLQTLQRIATEYAHVQTAANAGFESSFVNECIVVLPRILDDVVEVLEQMNAASAQKDDKYTFFRDEHETNAIKEHKAALVAIEQDFDEQRGDAARKLKKGRVEYCTVAGIDYLIEVENSNIKHVPASWTKISGTKKVSRFHTPEVVRLMRDRDQHKEALAAACDEAFTALLTTLAAKYQSFRDCIHALATLDCLLSLAQVAARPGYVKPVFTADTQLDIKGGRHPMAEQLLMDSYVPNDIFLSGKADIDDTCQSQNQSQSFGGGDGMQDSVEGSEGKATRALLITGPNMGGKSSFVRQTALISIMGQIGSYVPAASARLGMLDAVFTRMGAFDNMAAGESTFMVELSETADILKQATPRSLVILDELGRGTSTHDGVAIAHAVLDYFLRQSRCLLLFITHYQSLAAVAGSGLVGAHVLRNVHMRFEARKPNSALESESGGASGLQSRPDRDALQQSTNGAGASAKEQDQELELADEEEADEEITFLYDVAPGTAHRSYGLNVARLAHLPRAVLDVARANSRALEADVRDRRLRRIVASLAHLLGSDAGNGSSRVTSDGIDSVRSDGDVWAGTGIPEEGQGGEDSGDEDSGSGERGRNGVLGDWSALLERIETV